MMTYFDEQELYEPTLTDEIMHEFAQKMNAALIDTAKSKIDQVFNKNAQLEREKAKLLETISSLRSELSLLTRERREIERELRAESVEKMIAGMAAVAWAPSKVREEKDKCNKCDSKRNRPFTSPLGKKMVEKCECAEWWYTWKPVECELYNFYVGKNKQRTYFRYRHDPRYDGEFEKVSVTELCDNIDFDSKELGHNPIFESIENCQAYCDWKNRKKGN